MVRPIRSPVESSEQILEIAIKVCLVPLPCQARAGCSVPLNFIERLFEQVPQTPQKRPTGTSDASGPAKDAPKAQDEPNEPPRPPRPPKND
jgi:hypothetical protein